MSDVKYTSLDYSQQMMSEDSSNQSLTASCMDRDSNPPFPAEDGYLGQFIIL